MVIGADDGILRVYNYNTLEKVHQTEAHTDYVRSIDVHPTLSFILTSSDDTTIKLWDWDKGLKCVMVRPHCKDCYTTSAMVAYGACVEHLAHRMAQ